LSNCFQFVEIKETDCNNSVKISYISPCKKVERCLPKGSALGSLLTLLYIHDITENVQGAKMVSFAHDTNLLITGKDEFDLQYNIINVIKELEIRFQKIIS
jgi:hypothetical protein